MDTKQAIDEGRLIEAWIEENPYKRPVADAWLKEYGVAVWALIAHLQILGDVAEVAAAYAVPPEAVQAAIAYYERNKPPIDARIKMNAA